MGHTFGHYTQYDGDDGYKTLILKRCDLCGAHINHCDCDSNDATGDKSRQYVRGYD